MAESHAAGEFEFVFESAFVCDFEFEFGFGFCGVDCGFGFCGVDCGFEFWNQFWWCPITVAEEIAIIVMSNIAASLVVFILSQYYVLIKK
jgi:hypothetical protein